MVAEKGRTVSDAKAEILGRIRGALGSVREVPEVPRDYLPTSGLARQDLVALFIERATDYRAAVHRATVETLPETVAEVCRLRSASRLVAPSDIPGDWLPDGLEVVRDANLSYAALEAFDGVLSGCALAVAQTGTIVLDGGAAQGRRVLTLLPDLHLCVIFEAQIVGTVPEAVRALQPTAARPLTLISGPSATSDIELSRVEGVHGPRTLDIILVGES